MRQPNGRQFHDTALLEFIYALPSPKPQSVPSEPRVLLLWVCVGLLSAVYARGH